MKNTINLLLFLSLPFLVLSCSIKPTTTTPPTINIPPSTTQNQSTGPTLGTPIHVPTSPSSQPTVIMPSQIPTPVTTTPVIRQRAKEGESYVTKKFKLPETVKETSGLIKIDNQLWTFNDSGGKASLYQIDERRGAIVKTLTIQNAKNRDWEAITYDDTYVYIGDVGNNLGNRKDLKIYKIPRASLSNQNSARAEIINFSYSDQKDFTSRPQKHNFDCESMVTLNGKIYLFSKNWQNSKTRLYELSTTTGTQKAKYISTFNIQGLVTGATLNNELGILLLTTYSSLLDVNIWVFTNHSGDNFFKGEAKRLKLSSPLQGQVEGITFTDNYKAYLSSEAFKKYIFSMDAALYELDFRGEFE